MATRQRPVGVTILAVLALIAGVLSILAALAEFVTLGFSFGASALAGASSQLGGGLAGLTVLILALGVIVLISGILYLAFGIGAFRAAGWAWMLGIVSSILGLLGNIASIALAASNGTLSSVLTSDVIGIAVSIGILIYLNSAQVKAYFGRA